MPGCTRRSCIDSQIQRQRSGGALGARRSWVMECTVTLLWEIRDSPGKGRGSERIAGRDIERLPRTIAIYVLYAPLFRLTVRWL
ncbi:unnamed protein product [Lasius platythorax]|uniref:Uncharacterized protein n=1 Tax=Lasius platythorax TaxID=488582 RepID=A0AAV2N1T3_9HYME